MNLIVEIVCRPQYGIIFDDLVSILEIQDILLKRCDLLTFQI